MKIAFFDAKPFDKEFFDAANKSFGFEIKYFDAHLTPDTCVLAQGYDVVCAFVNDKISAVVIGKLKAQGVGLIALRCAGYNNVDLKAAKNQIKIVRVPSYSPYAVAEHALGMMLCLNRKLHRAYGRIRENNFSIVGLMGFDMHGKTAGVIGCGQIGSVMVGLLKGLGMKVLGYDIDKKLVQKAGAEFSDLQTLYKSCDIITLHCPLTPDNVHMINRDAISRMKEGVMLINTGRGGLIDTSALLEGLKSKKIGAAGLDVYEEENQYFYEDFSATFIPDDVLARLQTFPNVLITSHQAFFTREAMHNIAHTTLVNIQAYKSGKLVNEVSS
ncbi:MAG: 2-hydroxyacid dehydrogenase [Verrucomicrobia bacterium]|nr:2-hydroxyacid dehydrogenase [Verrucomicrobiota bacterium]